jgi:hypothetical protein
MASWAVQVHRPGSGSKWRGPRVSVPPPKGRSRSGPYPRPTTETHVGITAVETPGETIVSRLGFAAHPPKCAFLRADRHSLGRSQIQTAALFVRAKETPGQVIVTPAVIARDSLVPWRDRRPCPSHAQSVEGDDEARFMLRSPRIAPSQWRSRLSTAGSAHAAGRWRESLATRRAASVSLWQPRSGGDRGVGMLARALRFP